ncbi:ATP-dependent DNA helicase II subunit 1, variant 2 [Basidiobolus ranarum]|uniref:ATP-dependent DNA helicase II subunit 1 n=1 Tax=Basidiobolus ranarum TaxID=34480 RepID=A0ABR2W5Q6_9FUNG
MFEVEEDWDLLNDLQDIDEEVDEESETKKKWSNKDCVLFVIDCSPSMLELNENKEIPVHSALKCINSVLLDKIVTSNSDLLGILLYGTEETKNSGGLENIYLLQNLETPDATSIKELESLVNDKEKFLNTVSSTKTELPLGNVFWACSSILSTCQNVSSKRIILITNEDNPNRSNTVLQKAAKTRAKDLYDSHVEIELINLNKGSETFDYNLFYKDVLGESQMSQNSSRASDQFEKLLTRIKRKEARSRSIFTTQLKITDGLQIGIRGYALVGNQHKGSYKLVYMKSETPKQVKAITHWLCADTTQILQPSDLKFYYEYGGAKVVFTREEIAEMKKFGEPGLKIIGFKPRDRLKFHLNITHSLFIYPDETQYKGSTCVFTSFLLKMSEMNQVGICSFIPRKNTAPRFVAMVPQMEINDELGQSTPPGFHLIPLPFADDIRPVTVKTGERASEAEIDAAKEIVSKISIAEGYHPRNYPNPALQRHYMSLQSIALERDLEEELVDHTLPDADMIHDRVGDSVQMFKQILGVDDFNAVAPVLPPKRRVNISSS